MKKNITINLFGSLYAIDEDACKLLEQYLDNMKRYFSQREDGDEIVDDIEHRVAEIFTDMRAEGIQAINIDHVRDIGYAGYVGMIELARRVASALDSPIWAQVRRPAPWDTVQASPAATPARACALAA